jgi:hypothetical protein
MAEDDDFRKNLRRKIRGLKIRQQKCFQNRNWRQGLHMRSLRLLDRHLIFASYEFILKLLSIVENQDDDLELIKSQARKIAL